MTSIVQRELETMLRGEIAAAETYEQVLDGVDDPEAAPLREIRDDHGEAIKFFHRRLGERGVTPPPSSGVWGFFARTVEGTAKLLGEKRALSALREGERKGLSQYENAMLTPELPAECREHIGGTLVPAQQRHIDMLTRLIDRL